MNLLLAQGVAGSFLLISLIHLYWAAGGKRGSDAVIPEVPVSYTHLTLPTKA